MAVCNMNTGLTLGTAYDIASYVFFTSLGLVVYFDVLKPFIKRCVTDFKADRKIEKARKQDQEYRNGYGWAMAEVRLGNMKTYDLEMHIMSQFTEGTGKFEDGVERAIQDLNLLEFAETIEVPD